MTEDKPPTHKKLPIFQTIKEAIKIVNKNLILIPFIALSITLGSLFLSLSVSFKLPHPFVFIFLLLNLISFVLYTIVYGRLVEIVMNLRRSSWSYLLKVHLVNYLIFMMIGFIPIFILSFLLIKNASFLQKAIISNLYNILFSCLTIYVLPFVFLTRQVIYSILDGIKMLFKSLWISISLILLTICIYLMDIEIIMWGIVKILPLDTYSFFGICFILSIIIGLIIVYVSLIVFTAATSILKEAGMTAKSHKYGYIIYNKSKEHI